MRVVGGGVVDKEEKTCGFEIERGCALMYFKCDREPLFKTPKKIQPSEKITLLVISQ